MPKRYPDDLKRDVVEVASRGDLTIPEVATDFGVVEESLRRWMCQADVDQGIKDGMSISEQSELGRLRREKRRLEIKNEILRHAAAYFASSPLPTWRTRWSVTLPPKDSQWGRSSEQRVRTCRLPRIPPSIYRRLGDLLAARGLSQAYLPSHDQQHDSDLLL